MKIAVIEKYLFVLLFLISMFLFVLLFEFKLALPLMQLSLVR